LSIIQPEQKTTIVSISTKGRLKHDIKIFI
jgi:hypothetical protein